MTVIKGYAARPQPKWPILLAIVFLVLTGIAVLISLVPPSPSKETTTSVSMPSTSTTTMPPVTTSTTTMVTTTTRPRLIDIKLPTSNSGIKVEKIVFSSVEADNKIYCTTTILASSVPQSIRHVWVTPGGKVFAEIPLSISKPAVDTYSFISLSGAEAGVWEVRVEDAAGRLLAKSNFTAR